MADWTIHKVLGWTTEHFKGKGIDSPRLSAEVLLAHTLRCDRVKLYTDLSRPLDPPELASYRGLVSRRASGEPTSYLTGGREFYGRLFSVGPGVFIPRPETEHLVERCLQALPEGSEAKVLDLCAGSGCVGLTLAVERPAIRVWAVELDDAPAAASQANAEKLGVTARYQLLLGDLFEPARGLGSFEVVVSNPPYVGRGQIPTLSKEVRDFEPLKALDGGDDGLDFVRRIAGEAPRFLVPGGLLALEIGDEQGPAARSILEASGFGDAAVLRDYARKDRVVAGTLG